MEDVDKTPLNSYKFRDIRFSGKCALIEGIQSYLYYTHFF
jgi:hypothetical protein